MEWVAALLVVAILLTLAGALRGRRRSPHATRPRASTPLGVHPDDVRELAEVAERLLHAHRAERARQLIDHVHSIRARGLPVRGIAPIAAGDEWILRFADGSELVVVGLTSQAPWLVVRHLVVGTVALEDHRVEGGRLLLTLHAGQRRPEFIALGDV